MPETPGAPQFLDLVARSRLLPPATLAPYARQVRKQSPTSSRKDVAELLVQDGLLTTFQAEQIARGRWRRFFLGPYKLLEPLGAGGMGTVFLAEHTKLRRRVAVKLLAGQRSKKKGYLERFYRESRASIALNHPNVVRAYELGRDDDVHYLAMEYIDGISLHHLIDRTNLGPVRAAHYIRQAALGLQHAFEYGLVHRDIKPANLMVDRAGHVKLLDLGLARFYEDEDDDLTVRHQVDRIGTLDFMAPEQIKDSHNADVRSDVYGLGATLYCCLTRQLPLGKGTEYEKALRMHRGGPEPLSEVCRDLPEGLVAVVERMMARNPANRYPTPAAVAQALAPWSSARIPRPTAQEIPPRRSEKRDRVQASVAARAARLVQNPWRASLAIVGLLGLIVVLVGLWVRAMK